MKHIVSVPPEYWDLSMAHGRKIVRSYRLGRNPRSRALAVPGRARIDRNPKIQGWGKLFECAFCLWAGTDPAALDWSDRADPGYDLVWRGLRVDVKGSPSATASALIWPVSKNHFFARAAVDVFVFARRVNAHQPAQIELVGWTTKAHFAAHHETAWPGNARRFNPGTRYIDAAGLWDMDRLRGHEGIRAQEGSVP